VQKFKGNFPSGSWLKIGEIADDESGWYVFVKPQPNPEWETVKVCAVDPVVGKGNFWLAWSSAQKRLGSGADVFKLMQHRPTLTPQVEGVLAQMEGLDLL
jgi:hypothetical protein